MSLKDASSPQQTSTVAGNFICYLGLKARLCCKVIVFFSKCCWFVQFALNSFLVGNVIHKQEVTPAMNEHSKPERGRLIARLSPPQWPLRGWVGGGGTQILCYGYNSVMTSSSCEASPRSGAKMFRLHVNKLSRYNYRLEHGNVMPVLKWG